jgi:hypothetical protein
MSTLLACTCDLSTSSCSARQIVRSNLCTCRTYVVCDRIGRHCSKEAVSLKRSWVISSLARSFSAFFIISSSNAHSFASLIESDSLCDSSTYKDYVSLVQFNVYAMYDDYVR